MKIILPFLFLLLATTCLQAQNGTTAKPAGTSALTATTHTLHVFAENGEKFFLILEGEKVNAAPQARVTAPGLDKDYYKAKIIFDDERIADLNPNIQLEGVDPGWNDVTYIIKKKIKKGKAHYSLWPGSWKKIGNATAPAEEAVRQEQAKPAQIPHTEVQPTQPALRELTPDQSVSQAVDRNPAAPCNAPLPDAGFKSLLSSVEGASFEDMRLQTANVIADGNCLTTGQIKQIMGKLNFEDSRLAFAKTAYPKCLDKQNYLLVNDAFQFSTSKAALDRFILGQKK